MAFACCIYEKNKETALVRFAEKVEKMNSSREKGELYFFLPERISKDINISLFDVLDIVEVDIDPNSEDFGQIDRIYTISEVLSDCKGGAKIPSCEDFVIAPFFEMCDYSFLKKVEVETKCNVVCLAELSENLKNFQFDKLFYLNRNAGVRILLAKALQENKTFEEFVQIFREYMQSRQMSEEEQKQEMELALNVKYYFE